jgi:hypothetical protein
MYHLLYHTKTLHSAQTVYLCVPYGSHSKQRLFPQTALTGWALQWRRKVFPVRYGLDSYIVFRINSVFMGLRGENTRMEGHELILPHRFQFTDCYIMQTTDTASPYNSRNRNPGGGYQ